MPDLQAPGGAPLPGVSISGGLSAPVIGRDEDLRFWITIENKTDADLSQVRLVRLPEGYSVKEICFFGPRPNRTPPQQLACAKDSEIQQGDINLPQPVLAGQSMTVAGGLAPNTAHKKEILTLVIEWVAAGRPVSSSTVTLGENQVQTAWEDWSSSWFYQLLKDLALPVVLLVIGASLSLSAKRRDARSETLKLMLPISHKYAAKYYLPLSRATERAAIALYKITEYQQASTSPPSSASPPALSPDDLESFKLQAFFYILQGKRLLDLTRKAIGGVYFKNLRGEMLAASCIKSFDDLLGGDTREPALALQGLSSSLTESETYESFKKKFWDLSSPPTVLSPPNVPSPKDGEAWELFQDWVNEECNRQRALGLSSALALILEFEANQPYSYWYDEMEKMNWNRLDKNLNGKSYVNVKETLLGFAEGREERRKTERYLKEQRTRIMPRWLRWN